MNTPNPLNTLTIPQIKEYAKSKGLKVPSGLKKAELIDWIMAAETEVAYGFTFFNGAVSPKFKTSQAVPVRANPDMDWLTHLHTYGWAVVENAFTAEQTLEARTAFWNWISHCDVSGVKPNADGTPATPMFEAQPEGWSYDKVPTSGKGMFKNYIGHERFLWNLRRLSKPIFSRIWGTEDLVSSFDGACLALPTPKEEYGCWLHYDQWRDARHFACVQGIAALTDSNERDGGFCFVQPDGVSVGDFFSIMMDRHPTCGRKWGRIDVNDPYVANTPVRKICAPAGSMILFDSRLCHANIPSNGKYRMAAYISFQPRAAVPADIAAKRLKAFHDDIMTGHWCYGPWFGVCAKDVHSYGKFVARPMLSSRPAYEEVADLI